MESDIRIVSKMRAKRNSYSEVVKDLLKSKEAQSGFFDYTQSIKSVEQINRILSNIPNTFEGIMLKGEYQSLFTPGEIEEAELRINDLKKYLATRKKQNARNRVLMTSFSSKFTKRIPPKTMKKMRWRSILVSAVRCEDGPKNPYKGTSMKLLVSAANAQFGVGAGSKYRTMSGMRLRGGPQWHAAADPSAVETCACAHTWVRHRIEPACRCRNRRWVQCSLPCVERVGMTDKPFCVGQHGRAIAV